MQTHATIYIVDDDQGARMALQSLLENQNYELQFFENGQTLLDALQDNQPDLILLDVMMPGLSGFEVCERIRSSPALDGIPILMITALDGRQEKLRGLEAGADDFITKPFDRLELRARIKMVTNLNRYRRIVTAERRLMWVVDATAEGYLIVDENDTIRYANRKARQCLNLESGVQNSLPRFLDAIKKKFLLVPDFSWNGWPNDLFDAEDQRFLVRPETSEANAMWLKVDVLSTPSPAQSAYLLRLRDVSPQMQTQMEQFTFHSAINHKLRTPLGQIIGGLELIASSAEGVSDELFEMSRWALKGANQLSSQILEILSYARLSNLGLTSGMQISDMESLLKKIQTDLEVKQVKTYIDPALDGCSTVISEKALELVLRELHENAIKFHPEHDPNILIYIKQRSDESASLEVISNGQPLPIPALPRVWEPYFQSEKSYSGQVPGMGLGLSMVASIIWQSGGKCDIQNLPNENGVMVTLTIPLVRQV